MLFQTCIWLFFQTVLVPWTSIVWTKIWCKSMGMETIWLPTFIQIWNDMRVICWQNLNFWVNYTFKGHSNWNRLAIKKWPDINNVTSILTSTAEFNFMQMSSYAMRQLPMGVQAVIAAFQCKQGFRHYNMLFIHNNPTTKRECEDKVYKQCLISDQM